MGKTRRLQRILHKKRRKYNTDIYIYIFGGNRKGCYFEVVSVCESLVGLVVECCAQEVFASILDRGLKEFRR